MAWSTLVGSLCAIGELSSTPENIFDEMSPKNVSSSLTAHAENIFSEFIGEEPFLASIDSSISDLKRLFIERKNQLQIELNLLNNAEQDEKKDTVILISSALSKNNLFTVKETNSNDAKTDDVKEKLLANQ